MYAVILYVALTLPGHDEPVKFSKQMPDAASCSAAVAEMTAKANEELKAGGTLQVGCVVIVPPRVDN